MFYVVSDGCPTEHRGKKCPAECTPFMIIVCRSYPRDTDRPGLEVICDTDTDCKWYNNTYCFIIVYFIHPYDQNNPI